MRRIHSPFYLIGILQRALFNTSHEVYTSEIHTLAIFALHSIACSLYVAKLITVPHAKRKIIS